MKALVIAPEKKAADQPDVAVNADSDVCYRVGSLIIHSLGEIETNHDGFHSESYIYPPGYVATRIFWSTVFPRTRATYVLKIDRRVVVSKDAGGDGVETVPLFSIIPGDAPSSSKIMGVSYCVHHLLR